MQQQEQVKKPESRSTSVNIQRHKLGLGVQDNGAEQSYHQSGQGYVYKSTQGKQKQPQNTRIVLTDMPPVPDGRTSTSMEMRRHSQPKARPQETNMYGGQIKVSTQSSNRAASACRVGTAQTARQSLTKQGLVGSNMKQRKAA